jgi:hypothetical protein
MTMKERKEGLDETGMGREERHGLVWTKSAWRKTSRGSRQSQEGKTNVIPGRSWLLENDGFFAASAFTKLKSGFRISYGRVDDDRIGYDGKVSEGARPNEAGKRSASTSEAAISPSAETLFPPSTQHLPLSPTPTLEPRHTLKSDVPAMTKSTPSSAASPPTNLS